VEELKRLEPETASILDCPSWDLDSWADAYLPQSATSQRLQKLLEIHADWEVRLGRPADFEGALITSSQVIAGTCVGLAAIRGMRELEFDLCIVDEASKATPTEMLVPMCRARRWIIVGDSKQLPPFVEEGVDPALLAAHSLQQEMLSKTLFDRLEDQLPRECITTLNIQHRMVPQIGRLVSDCFYESSLQSAPKVWVDSLKSIAPKPVTWFTTSPLITRADARRGKSYSNPTEARIIADILIRLERVATNERLSGWDVVVLTGYGEKKQAINRDLPKMQFKTFRVGCYTVDAVQGKEAKIAIYSMTRSNPEKRLGFLREKPRLNVALSRGQQYLIIVGDHIFARDAEGPNPFAAVVNHIEQHSSNCMIKEFKR
jgi:superfamily I DNA and/or RNA helicase